MSCFNIRCGTRLAKNTLKFIVLSKVSFFFPCKLPHVVCTSTLASTALVSQLNNLPRSWASQPHNAQCTTAYNHLSKQFPQGMHILRDDHVKRKMYKMERQSSKCLFFLFFFYVSTLASSVSRLELFLVKQQVTRTQAKRGSRYKNKDNWRRR